MKKVKQHKAFIGALIGVGASVLGNVLQANAAKKQAKEQNELQARQQGITDTNAQAAAMSQTYNNQDYLNQYNDKITLKDGGNIKMMDRLKYEKRFACGGKKKACGGKKKLDGGNTTISSTAPKSNNGIGNEIVSGIGSIGNVVASSLFSKPASPYTNPNNVFSTTNKQSVVPTTYVDRLAQAKMGTKKRISKC